jgi:AraC-like DNA-binding protein
MVSSRRLPPRGTVDPVSGALIVIDVQESFRQQPMWAAISEPGIVGKVSQLVAAARDRGDLVVWVLHAEPGTGSVFDPDSGHVRLMDGLVPADGEPMITKTSHNAFTTTNLQQLLTTRAIGDLTVCGIRRHRGHLSDTVHVVQDLIDARFTERLRLADLAAASGVSQRTLTRLFRVATGMTPLRYQQLLRAERAEHLIGHGATVGAAARAAGFEEPRMLRRLRARA